MASCRYDPLHDKAVPPALVIPLEPPSPDAVAAYRAVLATLPAADRAAVVSAEIGTEVGLAEAARALRVAAADRAAKARLQAIVGPEKAGTAADLYTLGREARRPPRLMPAGAVNVAQLSAKRMADARAAQIARHSAETARLLAGRDKAPGPGEREVAGATTTAAGANRDAIRRLQAGAGLGPLPIGR
jgi:hypothetical protein